VGRLGEAMAELPETGVQQPVEGRGGNERMDFETLLEELTMAGPMGGLGGSNEDIHVQRAPPNGEDLAWIAALLALRNTSPLGDPPGHSPAPEETPEASHVGQKWMQHQKNIVRELPQVLMVERVVEQVAAVEQGQAGAARVLEIGRTDPGGADAEERSAGVRENRGALPCRRRDPWSSVETVLTVPRVEKATKKRVPLSRDWSHSKILTGPDHEAAVEQERLKKEAEEAEKERKKEERERRVAENAARIAGRKEEAEKARQARVDRAKTAAAKKEVAQKEKAAKRKFDGMWEVNTKVLQGLLYGGMVPQPCAHGWTPQLRPVPATVRAVRQRRMMKIRVQREFIAKRGEV
jgi:hypothetical protein